MKVGTITNGCTKRCLKVFGVLVLLAVLTSGVVVSLIFGATSGRVFGRDELASVPPQRAAVVLGCVKTLRNGLGNLYYSRRIAAAAELYKAGKVSCLIVSGDNHVKGYDEPTTIREQFAKFGAVLDVVIRRKPKFLGKKEALPE